jgi:hypothetical protein
MEVDLPGRDGRGAARAWRSLPARLWRPVHSQGVEVLAQPGLLVEVPPQSPRHVGQKIPLMSIGNEGPNWQ